MSEIPQPEDIYRRTKEEGARRLERPLLEMVSRRAVHENFLVPR